MIYILYSADYELFLGENFRPEREVLITPTDRLLTVCEAIGVPMTLFCDVISVWRYRDDGMPEFPDMVDEQLRDAIRRGHDVQAHIHPHWTYASQHGRQWTSPLDKFLLGNLSQDSREVEAIARGYFQKAARYFEDLLTPIRSDYRCIAYRAGNYGVQPRDHEVLAALEDAGYQIDSSVVPGLVMRNNVNEIDFRHVPAVANYRLNREGGFTKAADRGIFEIPIASTPQTKVELARILAHKVKEQAAIHLGRLAAVPQRGTSIQVASVNQGKLARLAGKVRSRFGADINWLELSTDEGAMLRTTRKYLARIKTSGDIYFSFSCHPKVLDERHFGALEKYHARLRKEYGADLQAISFQQAAALTNGKSHVD
jgi:hypothetical protein